MPQSLEAQVTTLGKLMDSIRKEFADLSKEMEGYYFKQTCPMIKNLQDRVTEVERQVVDVDKKTEGYYFKQTCPMIKNLQDRVTVLEK